MKFHRMRYLGSLFLTFLATQSALRLLLFIITIATVSLGVTDVLRTFAMGIFYDSCAAFFFCLPVALLLLFLPTSWLNRKGGRWIILAAAGFMNFLLAFSTVALFCFWQEFHTNFNFIAVDYLIYTTEMIGNIVEAYPMWAIVPALLAAAGGMTYWQSRFLCPPFNPKQKGRILAEVVLAMVVLSLITTSTRDEWREKVSPNQYNIELAGNGPYGFVHAFFRNELDYHRFYKEADANAVQFDLRSFLLADNVAFTGQDGIARQVDNRNELTERKLNIVLITVESLSADFCGAFGAQESWTPELDKLVPESYIFSRMYATGTRTVRGLEAISLSVPPTPGQSILRRPGCDNLATLGEAVEQNGYQRDFIYGGYGYFDNMNDFFSSNGYTIKDRVDIPGEEIVQETAWGVADEVLFNQVLKSMDEHAAKGERALEMIMTTSNHSPYTFPEGRVDAKQGEREGAVRYTDWAIGDFLRRAQEKSWFKDTVFVIIADHQARAAGKTELPVNRYRIPCLIYAPGIIAPGVNDRLVSQMDLAPTLLGMLGLSYKSQFMGRDIFHTPPESDRAFISTYQSMGYIRGDKLVILEPGRKVRIYEIKDWQNSVYKAVEPDAQLETEAVVWYQGASDLFNTGKLKVKQIFE